MSHAVLGIMFACLFGATTTLVNAVGDELDTKIQNSPILTIAQN